MLLMLLLLIPLAGIFLITTTMSHDNSYSNLRQIKVTGLLTSLINLFVSLIVFIFFNFSSNQFQFVQEYHKISSFDFYLGVDGLSIYFVILTTIIIPIALLSNWSSISENVQSYVVIILLLETLLLAVFLVLDVLLFYIFFESILPPLFILIGLFGSSNRVRASFYLFLYTFYGFFSVSVSVSVKKTNQRDIIPFLKV
jgi:NADH-ubiquinone oxidoreductase chain 4